MFMIIPQSALYPIRKLLERQRALDGTSVDPEWQKKMQDGLASSYHGAHRACWKDPR